MYTRACDFCTSEEHTRIVCLNVLATLLIVVIVAVLFIVVIVVIVGIVRRLKLIAIVD